MISQYINEVSFALRNTHMPKINVIHDTVKEYMGWTNPQVGWDPITTNIATSCCTGGWNFAVDSASVTTGDLTFATTANTAASTTIQGTRLFNHSTVTSDVATI